MEDNREHIQNHDINNLIKDVRSIIEKAHYHIANTINSETCLMNWKVGERIKNEVLLNERAEYEKKIIKNLAKKLTEEYGKGWSYYKLQHCVRAAYTFTKDESLMTIKRKKDINPQKLKSKKPYYLSNQKIVEKVNLITLCR